MRVIIQRVLNGAVSVDGAAPRTIGKGLVCLFGAGAGDDLSLVDKLAGKTAQLRVFEDDEGKMNLSAVELKLDILAVPNFTLYADTKKGLRPSFSAAADPAFAEQAFERYVEKLRGYSVGNVVTGEFGADMRVDIVGDGPVTIILDTKEWQG